MPRTHCCDPGTRIARALVLIMRVLSPWLGRDHPVPFCIRRCASDRSHCPRERASPPNADVVGPNLATSDRRQVGQWPSGLTSYRDFGRKNGYESMKTTVVKNGKQYCVFRRINEDQEFGVLMSITDNPQDSGVTTKISKQVGDAWREKARPTTLPPSFRLSPRTPNSQPPEFAPNPPRIRPESTPNLNSLHKCRAKKPTPNPPRIRPESAPNPCSEHPPFARA